MVSDEEVRTHCADAPLGLKIFVVVAGSLMVYGPLAIAVHGFSSKTLGSGAFAVAVLTALALSWILLPLRKGARDEYRRCNVVGYDLVWFLKDGELDNRIEPRNRRNALLNGSVFAIYRKLGGWGGWGFSLGMRRHDNDPYPQWSDSFSIRDAGNGMLHISDETGDRITWSIEEFVRVLNDYGVDKLRSYQRRLQERLWAFEARREGISSCARSMHSCLNEAIGLIDRTSRLKTTEEGKKVREFLKQRWYDFDAELKALKL
ncbi:MAG TPA: hypothetical protein VMJ72_02985 [Candidatus Paceibacterota bacterium]|nr:hypothetical protein [Candidatus Paceibacterota bacterium]